jgi:heme/copper-type cytochrome/quinol oxidase subunit 4
VSGDADDSTGRGKPTRSIGVEVAKFAFFAALTVLAAWVAATGRVAYMFTMLVIAAALGYAVLDCVGYEIVKKRRRR